MASQTTNQREFVRVLVISVVVAIVVVAALFFLNQKGTVTQQKAQNSPAIQNSDDLNKVSSDLDNTDITQLDTELNQVNTDAATF